MRRGSVAPPGDDTAGPFGDSMLGRVAPPKAEPPSEGPFTAAQKIRAVGGHGDATR